MLYTHDIILYAEGKEEQERQKAAVGNGEMKIHRDKTELMYSIMNTNVGKEHDTGRTGSKSDEYLKSPKSVRN